MIRKGGLILPLLLLAFILGVLFNIDKITDYTASLISQTKEVHADSENDYAKSDGFIYVQKATSFVPFDKQDIMNIFYTVLNSGYDTFTFYCPSEYNNCIEDVKEITNNQTVITDISNFVNPYNSFSSVSVSTSSLGEVTFSITKMYTPNQIEQIDANINAIFNEKFTKDMDIYDKILTVHDYIIDHAYYDLDNKENSGNAYGTLILGYSKCSGYADAMAIVLNKLGVKNFKVASQAHVWNAVYLDGEWYHLDLTWDDPIVENGTNITDTIRHKFYMIDTPTLTSYETSEHEFDKSVYAELAQIKE